MKIKNLLSAVAVTAGLACGTAQAALVNVGGVSWDPDAAGDLFAVTSVYENVTTTVGGSISGYGRVTEINAGSNFCSVAGCELTFTFGGFELQAFNASTGDFSFKNGWVNLWVDNTPDFSPFTTGGYASAADGDLWLSLAAVVHPLAGTLYPAGTTLQGAIDELLTLGGDGFAFLDVVYAGDLRNPETFGGTDEGMANKNFDTNSICPAGVSPFCADLFFNSDFSYNEALDGGTNGAFTHRGSADITGNSIPEPGVLALIGMGLAGLGFARRYKKQA